MLVTFLKIIPQHIEGQKKAMVDKSNVIFNVIIEL